MKTRKIYFAEEYRDKAGIGTTEYFNSADEAIEYAKDEWDHLNDADRKSYMNDSFSMFIAGQKWQTWDDDIEEWIDGDIIDVYYDALSSDKTDDYAAFLQRVNEAETWDEIDVDEYKVWCEAVGLDYSDYDDPDDLFDDLIGKLAEMRNDSLVGLNYDERIEYIYK